MKNVSVRMAVVIVAAALALPAGYAIAAKAKKPVAAKNTKVMDASQTETMTALKNAYPNFKVDELRKTPLPGIWEITAGQNILYFEPKTKALIFGEIVQQGGNNLTQIRRGELSEKIVKNIPLAKAVKIGNGPNTVIIFTDLQCGYCKKVSDYMRQNAKDVTQYVFLMPMQGAVSRAKAAYILSASDPAKTYNEVDEGKVTGVDWKSYKITDDASNKINVHMTEARKLAVQGTPNMWINGKHVAGANMPMIDGLIKGSKNQ